MATKKTKEIVAQEMEEVMGEYKRHELTSGRSGKKVTNPKQAKAIALSEARKAGAILPPPPTSGGKAKKT